MEKINAKWIKDTIDGFISSPENTLMNLANDPAWGTPLIGYSNGADPLYDFFKQDIGEFYVKPIEFIEKTFDNKKFVDKELTVVSWILPHTAATKIDHRKEKFWPSERWARARIFGEQVNSKLRMHVVQKLNEAGVEAVAPMLSPLWHNASSKKYGFASSWSERHAAYTAGLGTFGLSDGLITPLGKAHRAGSIIMNTFIEPSKRLYNDHHAYCLFYTKGTCGECIKKCPAGAISEKGHDKQKCSEYVDNTRKYVEDNFGFKGYGCGFCQVGVPCENKIPINFNVKNEN